MSWEVRTDRMGKNPRYFRDGEERPGAEFDAAFPPKPLGVPFAAIGVYPKRSEALAVHPKQVKEANERAVRHGLATRYEADGTAVIPSRAEQKKLVKLEGLHNKDGSFGD